jgi:hypothetical protein
VRSLHRQHGKTTLNTNFVKDHLTPEQSRCANGLRNNVPRSARKKTVAEKYKIPQAILNDIVQGQRHISAKVAGALGHRKLICYCPES